MGNECLGLFEEMIQKGVRPDEVTFLCMLLGCNHLGLVEEGKKIFGSMRLHGVFPDRRHYSCMVDLLGRAGFIKMSNVGRRATIKLMDLESEDPSVRYQLKNLPYKKEYRLNKEKAEWMIYVIDVGQREHFEMVFASAKLAGRLPQNENDFHKARHVGFGLVLGDDGKRFRTRSTEATEWTAEELEKTAEAVGYGAVKYADLKNNRLTNYTFNFDQMLSDKGNVTVYLLYPHARIC
uniref:Arginine--tRNA ligase, chloroplastic/mitochondrial-like n=1 Tax=Nicotiana tabacum TaxID=4097 RepID=A0A1S3XSZ1_TOBAC|nr:PREDICTED: arginine--tRNA ligase, chloroplastic/mitochondrial-like [Nicotiana tabacum]